MQGDKLDQIIALVQSVKEAGELHAERTEHNFKRVEQRLGSVEHRLDGMEHRLDGVEHRLDGVERRLVNLETTTHEGFARVDAQFAVVNERLSKLEARRSPRRSP